MKKGDYQQAINEFTEAIRLQPDLAEAFNERGLAYHHFEQYDKAIADYSECIRLNPDDVESYDKRANYCDKLAERDRAKAKELRHNKIPSARVRPDAGQ